MTVAIATLVIAAGGGELHSDDVPVNRRAAFGLGAQRRVFAEKDL